MDSSRPQAVIVVVALQECRPALDQGDVSISVHSGVAAGVDEEMTARVARDIGRRDSPAGRVGGLPDLEGRRGGRGPHVENSLDRHPVLAVTTPWKVVE